ncbi:exported hypothetical protein [Candidatus Desulfarcum epimagneticum]|uniref:Uncharacterized protein n=1 Tax=uncultured Desulfobacteraceae bacterium TaxID=218296 RepID=A0A484HH98_9BACT|nr:exported hypothetical protein [uncultured Desulfobacteraceae bacterium]
MKRSIMVCLSVLFFSTGCTVSSVKQDMATKDQMKSAEAAIKMAEAMGPEVQAMQEYKDARKYYEMAQGEYATKAQGESVSEYVRNASDLKNKASENSKKAWDKIVMALKKAKGLPGASKAPADWPVGPAKTQESAMSKAAGDDRMKSLEKQHGKTDRILLYGNALNLFMDKKYDESLKLFQKYVNNYSDSLTDNARYWIGESFYMKGDYLAALESFNTVVTRYPDSNKIPDALFKIGMCRYNMNENDLAREAFKKVIREHSDSNGAKRARNFLSLKMD